VLKHLPRSGVQGIVIFDAGSLGQMKQPLRLDPKTVGNQACLTHVRDQTLHFGAVATIESGNSKKLFVFGTIQGTLLIAGKAYGPVGFSAIHARHPRQRMEKDFWHIAKNGLQKLLRIAWSRAQFQWTARAPSDKKPRQSTRTLVDERRFPWVT
jgi:hypothetical protein